MVEPPEDMAERDLPNSQMYILQLLGQDLQLVGRDRLKLQPKNIAMNIGYKDSAYIGEMCRELWRRGMLKREGNGFYSITDEGLAYLQGKKDINEFPDPDEVDKEIEEEEEEQLGGGDE